ncbi:MAG: hypothetical protein COV72_06995 [Candidatus Omnitrophica bacterium CG11_big_fil_rev_8_21_14_0_20_42_13]|uniref:DUF2079 domain-containing protein n=1 Tax=Candidatus Ghiorseimicrobium undicola TaxID=1974746 RepID=A0A2H0LW67_9BACT|nr:MAG: hypothetical protein COV72_06995 [Candidatus Omnitrophica bacterium CG11_big_fil_rev_8_21_14_0_20_42_13]
MKFQLRSNEQSINRCVWFLIATYIIIFCYFSFLKLISFSYGDFDLAVDEQFLWNLGWRGSFYSSILGTNFFGNHLHFIIIFLLPFYKLLPYSLTLLWLQTFILALGAWPLYLLAKNVLSPSWGLLAVFAYLLYPPLAYTNLFEFHPVVFVVFFLLFTLYFYHTRRFVLFVVFLAICLLCQENVSLGIAVLGIYAWAQRRSKKWILTPLIFGTVYFIFAVKVLLPFFNKNTLHFLLLYRHFGSSYSEIFSNILLHPLGTFSYILQAEKLHYLFNLFAPLGLISLLSPISLLPAIPFFLQHLLSNRSTEITVYFHYAAELIPFIFTAFIFGIKRALSFAVFKKKSYLLALCLSGALILGSLRLWPHFTQAAANQWQVDTKDRIKKFFLKKIPPQAPVIATFEFLPFLAHRSGLYSFHHVYGGFHTISAKPYVLPSDIEYALLDFSDELTFGARGFFSPQGYENLRNFLSSGSWGIVNAVDSIVLFKKGEKRDIFLYKVMDVPPQPENKAGYVIENGIEFLGYDVLEDEGRFKVIFYWHCLEKIDKDITVFFHLVDSEGRIIYESLIPLCYRIYPTTAWAAGEYIREVKFLPFIQEVKTKGARWKMGFYNFLSGKGYPVIEKDTFGRIELNLK